MKSPKINWKTKYLRRPYKEKQWNSHVSNHNKIKTLNQSESVESMDIETDNIIRKHKLVDIYKKQKKHQMHLQSRTLYKAYTCETKFFSQALTIQITNYNYKSYIKKTN